MERKNTFNEDVANYDRYRPRYCRALFDKVIEYVCLGMGKSVVEIGCGTGQATEPFLCTGADVVAVELGDALAQYVGEKYKKYTNFVVKNMPFEEYSCIKESVDLVYSATAFHWIKQPMGYHKIYEMLKKDGVLALFWNKPIVSPVNINMQEAIQKAYQKNIYTEKGRQLFDLPGKGAVKAAGENGVLNDMRAYGFVPEEKAFTYTGYREFCANEYIALMETYSDHRILPAAIKKTFYKEMVDIINHYGGKIQLEDSMTLYLARKGK